MRGEETFSWARNGFQEFVSGWKTHAGEEREQKYLGFWLRRWLEQGDGVRETGGDYETYKSIAIDIVDSVMQQEVSFDYRPNRDEHVERSAPIGVHSPDCPYGAVYLDREFYQMMVYDKTFRGL